MLKLLAGILCLGGLLRLVNLNNHPAGFTPDEAAFGYNAYSLVHTGRDEWGTPFYALGYSGLLSFGDDKSPLYAVLSAPLITLFGLSHFSVRLANAIIGTLTISAVFLLASKLFPGNYAKHRLSSVPVIASLLIALSPWSVQLSRGAFEANLVLFFLPLAIVLLMNKQVLLSAFIAALSIYSYHSGRFLTLPVLILFAVSARISLKQLKVCGILMLIFLLPLIHSTITRPNTRTIDVSIFSPDDKWAEVVKRRYEANLSGTPDFLARLIHNRPRAIVEKFTGNYLEYFSPAFLFISGPREATYGMVKGWGVLLPIFAVGIPLGIYLVFKKRLPTIGIIGLLIISPIPAALTKGPGLAGNRAALLLIPLTILAALGITLIPKKIKMLLIVISIFYAGISVYNYHCCSQTQFAADMLYGYRELFSRLDPSDWKSSPVLVSRSLSEPHIYVAFYTQTSPRIYQANSLSWRDFQSKGFTFLDQMDGYKLENFTFGSIPKIILTDTLVISRPAEANQDSPPLVKVYYPSSNEISVAAYKIKP